MTRQFVLQTETSKRIREQRQTRVTAPSQVYSLDTLASNADILARCGGQATLVFRAIVGSYMLSDTEHRETGFKILPAFRQAIQIPDRQYQRATSKLENAGYIERDSAPGKKIRFRLTPVGLKALARTPAPR